MADPAHAGQGVRDALDDVGGAAQDQHLEAQVSIEMDVECGEDCRVVLVLYPRESVAEFADVVVVHHRERADHLAGSRLPGRIDEPVADQVANRLRAIGVAGLDDMLVKTPDEVRGNGNTEPDEFGSFSLFHEHPQVSDPLEW